MELREIEENFEIDRSIVSALKGAELAGTTAAERRWVWAKHEGRNTRYIADDRYARGARRCFLAIK